MYEASRDLEFPRFRGHLTEPNLAGREGCLLVPKTPPYSDEFRREAVRLLNSSGRSIPQLARELGCSPQSLRTWARQARNTSPAAIPSARQVLLIVEEFSAIADGERMARMVEVVRSYGAAVVLAPYAPAADEADRVERASACAPSQAVASRTTRAFSDDSPS